LFLIGCERRNEEWEKGSSTESARTKEYNEIINGQKESRVKPIEVAANDGNGNCFLGVPTKPKMGALTQI
jgi:hypothetical protein